LLLLPPVMTIGSGEKRLADRMLPRDKDIGKPSSNERDNGTHCSLGTEIRFALNFTYDSHR
jgi:hypothetical protein